MAHDHASIPDEPAPDRTRRLLALAVAPFVLLTLIGLVVLWPGGGRDRSAAQDVGLTSELYDATVVTVDRGPCMGTDPEADITCAVLEVRLTEGPDDGEVVSLPELSEAGQAARPDEGDRIVVSYYADAEPDFQYSFADRQRRTPLLALGLLFAIAVVVLGRWHGARALLGLVVSLLVIIRFVLPAILDGSSPLPVALVGCSAVALTALYLAHGANVRTTTAVLGTLASLALTGLLAFVFVGLADFTGLADEESTFLQVFASQVDLRGLLLAGFVIGSLGVLDDVTVTQVSAVWQLHLANPTYSFRQLYGAAVRIGRDHIASTVNTLVLAYAGASLPLLLLFTEAHQSLSDVVNGEVVAVEVVRTLVGSIGLVASVPITTALAALVVVRTAAGGERVVAS